MADKHDKPMENKEVYSDGRTGGRTAKILYHVRRFVYCTALYFLIATMVVSLIFYHLVNPGAPLEVSSMVLDLVFAAILTAINYLLNTKIPKVLAYCLHFILSYAAFMFIYLILGQKLSNPQLLFYVTVLYVPLYAAVMGLRALYFKLLRRKEERQAPYEKQFTLYK